MLYYKVGKELFYKILKRKIFDPKTDVFTDWYRSKQEKEKAQFKKKMKQTLKIIIFRNTFFENLSKELP